MISRKAFRTFSEKHPEASQALDEFYGKIKRCSPRTMAELRQTFPSADRVGDCIVFNVGGNKYRVIARLNYTHQKVFIRFVLSHAEYNKGKWKSDC